MHSILVDLSVELGHWPFIGGDRVTGNRKRNEGDIHRKGTGSSTAIKM